MNFGFRIMSLPAKRGNPDCGLRTDLRPPACAGPLYETKPIVRDKPNLARPGQGWVRRAEDAKQSQFGGKWLKEKKLWWIGQPDASAETNAPCCGQMRQTNPIPRLRIADCGLGRVSGRTPAVQAAAPAPADCAKQTQLPEAGHRGGVRESAGAIPSIPLFYHSTIPVHVYRAKQTQSRERTGRGRGPIVRNKANSTGSIGRASIVQERNYGEFTSAELRQNKANPPRPRVGRGLGDEMRLCKTNPICPAVPGRPALSCKTNPIWEARRRRGVPLRTNKANSAPWPVVRNKPNLPQTGRQDHRQGQRPWRCPPSGAIAPKKANRPRAGIPHHSTIPSFQRSRPRAGVQTKPILLSWAGYRTPPRGSTKCRHRRQP
jgi:hypothetical protein